MTQLYRCISIPEDYTFDLSTHEWEQHLTITKTYSCRYIKKHYRYDECIRIMGTDKGSYVYAPISYFTRVLPSPAKLAIEELTQ